MAQLTLADLKLYLTYLLDQRGELLMQSAIGRAYHPVLVERRRQIEDLPSEVTGDGLPLADQLTHTAVRHEALAEAIDLMTRACEAIPLDYTGISPSVREAARAVRTALVPRRNGLRRPEWRVMGTAECRARLTQLEPQLRMLPTPGGETVYEWAEAFVAEGAKLHELLTRRADSVQPIQAQTRDCDAAARDNTRAAGADALRARRRNRDEHRPAADAGSPAVRLSR
jgi:hypothetical protein